MLKIRKTSLLAISALLMLLPAQSTAMVPVDSKLPQVSVNLNPLFEVEAGFSGPDSVVEGQEFRIALTLTSKSELGSVVSVSASSDIQGDACHANGLTIAGGTALGQGWYFIAGNALSGRNLMESRALEVDVVPSEKLIVSWHGVADVPGDCRFGADINTLTSGSHNIWHQVQVLPDFASVTIDLGHIATVGGQLKFDRAKTVRPPAASEVTIITPSPRVLAMMSAEISHDDGFSWRDTGRFSISPGADGDLLEALGVTADLRWTMTLSDDGDTIAPWLAIGQFTASASGFRNQACLEGAYYDNEDKKGSHRHCVDVIVKQEVSLELSDLGPIEPLARAMLERTANAFIPTGTPNVFYYFEDTRLAKN